MSKKEKKIRCPECGAIMKKKIVPMLFEVGQDKEKIKLLEVIQKIKIRASKMKREDGAYDKTAEDIRKILTEANL